MRNVRRYDVPFTSCFITVVTHNRRSILLNDPKLFFECSRDLVLDAWVLMPDHFHAIIPLSGADLSRAMHRFKITYSRRFRDARGGGRVWQNRFWDHFIRDSDDLRSCLDYIHYNPEYHEVVNDPYSYPYSSLKKYVEMGFYDTPDWLESARKDNNPYGE
jgi:putative transposase